MHKKQEKQQKIVQIQRNQNLPAVTKQIAKKISINRYLREFATYELTIHWEGEPEPCLTYLPEIWLYPYSLRPTAQSPAQISKINERRQNLTTLQIQVSQDKSGWVRESNCLWGRPQMKNKAELLDYDKQKSFAQIQAVILRRNKDVLKGVEIDVSKKRK